MYRIKDRTQWLTYVETWYKDGPGMELLGWDGAASEVELVPPAVRGEPWNCARCVRALSFSAAGRTLATLNALLASGDAAVPAQPFTTRRFAQPLAPAPTLI